MLGARYPAAALGAPRGAHYGETVSDSPEIGWIHECFSIRKLLKVCRSLISCRRLLSSCSFRRRETAFRAGRRARELMYY